MALLAVGANVGCFNDPGGRGLADVYVSENHAESVILLICNKNENLMT